MTDREARSENIDLEPYKEFPTQTTSKLIAAVEALRERVTRVERDSLTEAVRESQQQSRELLKRNYGLEPNELQMKWREQPPPNKAEGNELEDAVVDALVEQGPTVAWSGDGVSCVSQMIESQMARAEAAEALNKEMAEAIHEFIEHRSKVFELQMADRLDEMPMSRIDEIIYKLHAVLKKARP